MMPNQDIITNMNLQSHSLAGLLVAILMLDRMAGSSSLSERPDSRIAAHAERLRQFPEQLLHSSNPLRQQQQQQQQQQLQQHQRQLQSNINILNGTHLNSPLLNALPERGDDRLELEFGAKVALFLLSSTALLVFSATLYDLYRRRPTGAHRHSKLDKLSQLNSAKCNQSIKQQQQQPAGCLARYSRDQRSPSLSSTSSSSLFCSSANSVASASAPILGRQAALRAKATSLLMKGDGQDSASRRQSSGSQFNQFNGTKFSEHSNGRGGGVLWRLMGRSGGARKQQQQHYAHNIRMLAASGCCSSSESVSPIESQSEPINETAALNLAKRQQECALLAAAMQGADRWLHNGKCNQPIGGFESSAIVATSATLATSSSEMERDTLQHSAGSLLEQVILSFSLCHSAAIIFQTSSEKSAGESATAPANQTHCSELACQLGLLLGSAGRLGRSAAGCAGHRSRLPSLSSINESAGNQAVAAAAAAQEAGSQVEHFEKESLGDLDLEQQQHCVGQHPLKATNLQFSPLIRADAAEDKQSIDSLHGLRFLSMIWIIVVHSYTLATRWSFFTNNAALDNIYKTAASQLLSNGTFACDSFFFTGGFLLAYLAFPNSHSGQQLLASSSSSSSPSSSSGKLTSASKCKCNCKLLAMAAASGFNGCSSSTRSCCSSPDSSQQQAVGVQQETDTMSQASSGGGCLCNTTTTTNNNSSSSNNNSNTSACTGNQASRFKANKFTFNRVLENLLHRYIRMMPLMMAVIGLSISSLRFLGEGPAWDSSTMMFDKWCRKNWWINALFLHNFVNRENMCLSHSWYSAVDIQLFLVGQLVLLALYKSKLFGLIICLGLLLAAPIVTAALTLLHHLPAVPLMISSVSEQSLSLYYGEIYIKPYCRAAPYLIGILLAYFMRTTSLGQIRLNKWQVVVGWTASLSCLLAILLATQPAMNGQAPSELASALYSALSRPLWAAATGWMIFACITKHGGPFAAILSAPCFVPLSRLTYPAFLIHPIVMAVFYGSRQESFSHYLMLYLILGHIVITYVLAFMLSALFELPIISAERAIKRARQAKKTL